MDPEIKNGNPLWLLGALPVFFLVWVVVGIGYAFIAGLGALAILYVLFVWLPNDEARKLTRKAKFTEAKKLLKTVTAQLDVVKDYEIREEVGKALITLGGLIDSLESKSTAQGKIEEKVLPMLRNLSGLLTRWTGNESYRLPLDQDDVTKIRGVLLHFDDLIIKYQKDGIDQTDSYLAGLYELETDMKSAGINPDDGGK